MIILFSITLIAIIQAYRSYPKILPDYSATARLMQEGINEICMEEYKGMMSTKEGEL